MNSRAGKKNGFTLIEAVVALTLAATGFAALYQLYAGAANAERAASETVYAARLAESLMAEADPEAEGESGGYRWTVERAPSPAGIALETLVLTVTAPSGREIRVVTERANPPASGNPEP